MTRTGPFTIKIETFRDERKTRCLNYSAACNLASNIINAAAERMSVTALNFRGEELDEFNTSI